MIASAAPAPPPTNNPALRLFLLEVTPAIDALRGDVRQLAFRLAGASGVGLARLEIATSLAGSSNWQNLATLAGTTLSNAVDRHVLTLPADAAPQGAFFRWTEQTETLVSHEATGRLPFLLLNVSYGVDEEQSFDLAYTRYRIERAADLARSNNFAFASPPTETPVPGVLTKFHFWPNIIDLTEIQFLDEPLYDRIAAEILENEPARVAITADWKLRVRRGERMYLARDFISSLDTGGLGFADVHYAFVINLDAMCAQELQVHHQEEQGLARLHDRLIDTLNERFASAATLPLGEVWHLCLRGNLRRSHSQAIIVDKLTATSAGEFFVARLYATCRAGGGGGTPPPTFEDEPPPIPEPPPRGGGGNGSNGERAASKVPGAPRPPDRGEGEPPVRPWPGGEKEYEEPPQGPEGPAGGGNSGQIPNLQNEQQKIQQLLDQARMSAAQMRMKVEQDLAAFRAMSFEWINGVTFNDPSMQEKYNRYAAQVAALQTQIAERNATAGGSVASLAMMRTNASPAVRALLSKQGLWDNMITVAGAWSNIRVPCLPPLIPGIGLRIEGVIIYADQTKAFHDDLYKAMVNGKSWDEAVALALADPKRYPPEVPYGDKIFQGIWKALANCYRDLFTAMFRIYLRSVFPALTDEQREEMIPALFDCDKPLTPAQRAEWQALLDKFKESETAVAAQLAQIQTLENQIKDLLHQFRLEARPCLDRAIAGVRELEAIARILEAALVEARTPGAPGSLPLVGTNFCDTLRKMLTFPPVQNCPGLREYLMRRLAANCSPPGGG